jgi:hypothetical protein
LRVAIGGFELVGSEDRHTHGSRDRYGFFRRISS